MLRAQAVALARPTELLRLVCRDVLLPSDLCETAAVAFVVFKLPKGRWSRRAPKKEHVRVDDPDAIAFLERTIGAWEAAEPLFPRLRVGDRFRTVWDVLYTARGSLGSVSSAEDPTASRPAVCARARVTSSTRGPASRRSSRGSRATNTAKRRGAPCRRVRQHSRSHAFPACTAIECARSQQLLRGCSRRPATVDHTRHR